MMFCGLLLYQSWALAPGLSFPYPSSRLMTPQIPRPAPRAMTKICKTSTALLKKSIFYVPESFLYGFYDGNRKAGMSWLPCAAVDSGFSFQIFGCAFLRLCVSRVSAALSASSFTEWVSDLYKNPPNQADSEPAAAPASKTSNSSSGFSLSFVERNFSMSKAFFGSASERYR